MLMNHLRLIYYLWESNNEESPERAGLGQLTLNEKLALRN